MHFYNSIILRVYHQQALLNGTVIRRYEGYTFGGIAQDSSHIKEARQKAWRQRGGVDAG
ncbi:hypothetical protein [Paraflavitalea speifideaquila]|uniref:hypothetical protein n=1 Tax=Paraflavitalea speifideaquila TaxID=3076558 RepID=UPI0028ED5120|nr:hypothetical protein [Paraflavitalea speifideiaquila]